MYNISSERFIDSAAISKQCSKGYFYGDDLQIEKGLGMIESKYSKCISDLECGDVEGFLENIFWVRLFCLIQYNRTKVALSRSVEYLEKMELMVNPNSIDSVASGLSDRSVISFSIVSAFKSRSFVKDLDFVVVRNKCKEDFISSDDPCVIVNKFYSQKFPKVSFGLSSSGLIFILPVTPRLCVVLFDANVYRIEGRQGCFVNVDRYSDLVTLNLLQCLKAEANVYFRDKANVGNLKSWFSDVANNRLESWCNVNKAVEDSNEPGVYRVLKEGEQTEGTKFLYHYEDIRAQPVSWPAFLRYRLKPKTYFDGSAMGHIRPETVCLIDQLH